MLPNAVVSNSIFVELLPSITNRADKIMRSRPVARKSREETDVFSSAPLTPVGSPASSKAAEVSGVSGYRSTSTAHRTQQHIPLRYILVLEGITGYVAANENTTKIEVYCHRKTPAAVRCCRTLLLALGHKVPYHSRPRMSIVNAEQ